MPIDGNIANGPDSATELHNAYLEGKHDGFNQGLASGRAERDKAWRKAIEAARDEGWEIAKDDTDRYERADKMDDLLAKLLEAP